METVKLLSVIVVLISSLHTGDSVLQCYKCTTVRPPMHSNETVRLCSDFDYSDKFVVDCPYSTFCVKKAYSAKIANVINATERDCANQKDVSQNYQDGSWRPKVTIEEPYVAECRQVDDKGLKTSTTIDCYCNSYLCNGAVVSVTSFTTISAAVILYLSL